MDGNQHNQSSGTVIGDHPKGPQAGGQRLARLSVMALMASVMLSACLADPLPSSADISPAPSADLVADQEWLDRLTFWLGVGYAEGPAGAAFASIDPELLRSPSLYNTYGAIGVQRELELRTSDPQAVVRWIENLRNAEGAFDDPALDLPVLIETYWALRVLRWLGGDLNGRGATRTYLLELQGEDGLFRSQGGFGGSETEDAFIATHYAVESLLMLGESPQDEALSGCEDGLQRQLSSMIQDGAAPIEAPASTYLIGGAHTLARINPSALGGQLRAYLAGLIRGVPSLGTDPGSISRLNMLMETGDLLAEGPSADMQVPLGDYISAQIVPLVGKILEQPSLDAGMLYETIRLLRQDEINLELREAVRKALAGPRIDQGWIGVIIPIPNPEATYYALGISDLIGLQDYGRLQVIDYLRQELDPIRAGLDLRIAYASVRGLRLLGAELDPAIATELRRAALGRISAGADPGTEMDELYWFCQLARELDWQVRGLVRSRLEAEAEKIAAGREQTSIRALHHLLLLQGVLDRHFLADDVISDLVMDLQTPQGGFRPSLEISIPDVHTTYLAISALSSLDRLESLNREQLVDYLEACRADFGFSYVALSIETESEETGPMQIDLLSTYDGLRILEMLSTTNHQPVGSSARPGGL